MLTFVNKHKCFKIIKFPISSFKENIYKRMAYY